MALGWPYSTACCHSLHKFKQQEEDQQKAVAAVPSKQANKPIVTDVIT
jgi:hypothetical protein